MYLEHHGILGQKWGVRRFQNPDGSLTKAGQKRYGGDRDWKSDKQIENRLNDVSKAIAYNTRDARDSKRVKEAIEKKYKDSNKEISKRNAKKLEEATEKEKTSLKRIKEGQKEIDRILKNCGEKYIDVESKDIKRDTTRGKEEIASALTIVGASALGIVPGPNVAFISAVAANHNLHKRNEVDSKSYKVKKSSDVSDKDADLRRNADEIMRYYDPKYHKDADKYIKQMSNEQLMKSIRTHRDARDEWKNIADKSGDKLDRDEYKQFEKNAKRYEKELKRRAGSDFDGNLNYNGYEIPKKAPKHPVDQITIIEEAVKAANGGKPYNSVYEFGEAYQKIGKEINNHWNNKQKNRK